MDSPATTPPILDEQNAAFIQGPVSIVATSRDEARVPSVARMLGCRISADRRTVTVLLAESQAAMLLADLRCGAPIAVVFSRPSTHQSIQLKAPRAEIANAGPEDRALKERYATGFIAEVVAVGDLKAPMHAYVWCDLEELVAVSFVPTAAFNQTPGPGAGAALPAGR
jgi:hypothetical protein